MKLLLNKLLKPLDVIFYPLLSFNLTAAFHQCLFIPCVKCHSSLSPDQHSVSPTPQGLCTNI